VSCSSPSGRKIYGNDFWQEFAKQRPRGFDSRAPLVDRPDALLNGDPVKGSMKTGCDLVGQNELGRVSVVFEKLQRVDFER
jgi:hypothetical protein